MTDEKTYGEIAAKKADGAITIRGIAGISVEPEAFNDFEILEIIMTLNDDAADDIEKVRAITAFGPLVFGAKEWKRIKSELREQNGGKLTNETVMAFIHETMAAFNSAKNF